MDTIQIVGLIILIPCGILLYTLMCLILYGLYKDIKGEGDWFGK